jgi:hypothetical protein
MQGNIGDGKTSIRIDQATGEIIVYPEGNPVGLIQMSSASGIFIADARFPSPGLFTVDRPNEKGWTVFSQDAFSFNLNLGSIVPSGISGSFLLSDLTLTGARGFGTDSRDLDLVYTSHGGLFLAGQRCAARTTCGGRPRWTPISGIDRRRTGQLEQPECGHTESNTGD